MHCPRVVMVRGLPVHVCMRGPSPTLPRLWSDERYEDESTKKVPDYLVALARVCADDLSSESHTQPMVVEVHPPSGIVPAGDVVLEEAGAREVIPAPPRRPDPRSFAFAATLDAFASSEVPFLALAENDAPAARPGSRRLRANITQSIAAAILALAAVLMLFALGTKPRVIVEPAARTYVTARARADHDDVSGSARAHAAPRGTTARVEWRPAPPPPRALAAPPAPPVVKAPGRIIRTAPF